MTAQGCNREMRNTTKEEIIKIMQNRKEEARKN